MYLRDLQDEDFEVAIKVELLKFLWAVEFCITCEIVLQIVQDTIFFTFSSSKRCHKYFSASHELIHTLLRW